MLTAARNDMLTRVGPGTPMGALLRRYWQPIGGASELDGANPIKPIRLLGEDLVLYRDRAGRYGLIDRHCPHRRADMSYGWVEERGIRCSYHGWFFDQTGRCLEQPYEDTTNPKPSKSGCEVKAYPVTECAGLLFAYMGPLPAPELPIWEPFTWSNGFREIVLADIPCNWFQCQENSIDPVHFEWMHDNWGARLKGRNDYAPRHLKLAFDEFEYGITYRRVREDSDENNPLWTVGRVCLWPNALFTGNHFEWRVPIDDTNTLSVGWFFTRVPKDREPYVQNSIPYWYSPIADEKTGRWITSHIMNQDFIGWVGQGAVTDRKREHLGRSDRGIIMMRQRFFRDLESLDGGGDPKAVVRDAEANRCIELPIIGRKSFVEGLAREEIVRRDFPFLVGQPETVRRAYNDAMGFAD